MVARGWEKYATVNWNKVVAPLGMRVSIRNLRELLWDETLADGNTEARFKRWAAGECRDVRFEADTRIASEMKHGVVPDYNHLNLYDIQNEAQLYVKDNPERAEAIYAGLTESLGIHYNMIDDSSGKFWPLFEECMEEMGECIERQNLSVEDKHSCIRYLVGWSTAVFSDFMPYYEKELMRLCTDVADLEVWETEVEKELEVDDIEDRDCYWAVNKKGIEEMLERVRDLIKRRKSAA